MTWNLCATMSSGMRLTIMKLSVKPKTGMACLPLTSPARGICITSRALFEFQLCIRNEDSLRLRDEPKGDKLIEGCTEFTNTLRSTSFTETVRLYGEKCGLDVKFALLVNAVQAAVDVVIIHSPACGLNLKLYTKTSGFSDVIRLFRGVAQSGRRITSVVTVMRRSHLDLCIEGSPTDNGLGEKLPCIRWEHRFGAGFHGTVDEVVKLGDFTTISVKSHLESCRQASAAKGIDELLCTVKTGGCYACGKFSHNIFRLSTQAN